MKTEIVETKSVGRPSMYNEVLQAKFDKAIDDMSEDFEQFFKGLPIMDSIAYKLDVSDVTLYDWCKKHPVFLKSVKRWHRKRNQYFVQLVPKFLEYPKGVTMFIFWAKNILKFEDVYKIEDATGEHSMELEVESETFKVQVLKELADAERHGVNPLQIAKVKKLLDVKAEDVTNKAAGNNGAGTNNNTV